MLGQHRDLYVLPEINPFLGDTIGAMIDILSLVRPRSLDGMNRLVAQLEYGEQSFETIPKARAWIEQRRTWTPERLFDYISERIAPRRPIEKSPSTVVTRHGIDTALAVFPNACFLHLYRHPVSTCSSIAKITKYGEIRGLRAHIARDPETSWFEANAAIVEAASRIQPGRFMIARGEDILSDPDTFLSQVCEWLELDVTPNDLAAMRHPERSPFAQIGPINAPYGNDPGFLENPRYVARPIRNQSLSSELDWAGNGRRLTPQTVALSNQLGYFDAVTF